MISKQPSIIEQDIVLIYYDNNPAFYARVEKIIADYKPKWWRVKFLFLIVPVQVVTWIIDEEQIRGADFTMGGTPVRIEKVVIPKEADMNAEGKEGSLNNQGSEQKQPGKARVLSMTDKKKKT